MGDKQTRPLPEWRPTDAEPRGAMMEPNIWVWVWVLLAGILTIAEITSGGLYALPFAVGAAVAAGLEFAMPGSLTWQWAAFLGVSSVIFVIAQRLKHRSCEVR